MFKKKYLVLTVIISRYVSGSLSLAQLPAFPGAEGFGSQTPGGRGGKVYIVTNLNEYGSGSLRKALEASGPRIVTFAVGGTIVLRSVIKVEDPYLTIAGQTAPGDGICLRGGGLSIRTHDVIVRGLRIRIGDEPGGPSALDRDGIHVAGDASEVYNNIIDHCSLSWAIDKVATMWGSVHDITWQWNIMSEALWHSIHPKGAHSRGLLIGDYSHNISVHHNLMVHNNKRSPRMKGGTSGEIVNNLVYNWGEYGTHFGAFTGDSRDPVFFNVICNYYIPGPNSTTNRAIYFYTDSAHLLPYTSECYVQGNINPMRPNDTLPEWDAVNGDTAYQSFEYAISPSGITTRTAAEARDFVLENAGAIVPHRDEVDLRIVNDVINGTGSIIDSQDEVDGWPTYASGTKRVDTDSDGMPDSFELENTSPSSSTALIGNNTSPSGYTWIEEYINGFIPSVDTTYNSDSQNNIILEKDMGAVPEKMNLLDCYPNPFNPSTNITYTLSRIGRVKLVVYDVTGRIKAILEDGVQKTAGKYKYEWEGVDPDGQQLPSGVYFCRFRVGSYVKTIKMMLMR